MIYLSMELKDLHNWNQVDSNRKGRCMVCLGLRDGWKCGLFCSFFQWHSQVLMGNLAVLLLICVHLLLGSSTTKGKNCPDYCHPSCWIFSTNPQQWSVWSKCVIPHFTLSSSCNKIRKGNQQHFCNIAYYCKIPYLAVLDDGVDFKRTDGRARYLLMQDFEEKQSIHCENIEATPTTIRKWINGKYLFFRKNKTNGWHLPGCSIPS